MDRPIKSKGVYDLNFIDWQNEHQVISRGDYDGETVPRESPIVGMSAENFHQLMLAESVQMRVEEEGVQEGLEGVGVDLSRIKKMKVGNCTKECAVCFQGFIKGQIIRVLRCNHIFHDNCIVPWFTRNSTCPNCRQQVTP